MFFAPVFGWKQASTTGYRRNIGHANLTSSPFFTSAPGYITARPSSLYSFQVIVRTVRKSVPANNRHITHAIGMNLIMVILTIGGTELLARGFSKETPTGEALLVNI